MDRDALTNLLEIRIPVEFQSSDLAYLTYQQGHNYGTKRARVLTGTKRDIGVELPAELSGRELAGRAWMQGQCDGYKREIELFEQIDQKAIADWENEGDTAARSIRGGMFSASLVFLAFGLLLACGMAGCASEIQHGFYDGFDKRGNGLPAAETVDATPAAPDCPTGR